jgi:hypothetical protein
MTILLEFHQEILINNNINNNLNSNQYKIVIYLKKILFQLHLTNLITLILKSHIL